MIQQVVAVAAWASVALIAYATLLQHASIYRFYERLLPIISHPAQVPSIQHSLQILAFAIVGALFGFAYDRQTAIVFLVIVSGAALSEVSQIFTRDRHARILDAASKMAGGAIGTLAGKAIFLSV
jgi:VanZ family protein